jgi:hypothetical protein
MISPNIEHKVFKCCNMPEAGRIAVVHLRMVN